MKVALLQPDIAWEDVPTNHARAARLLERAAALGARLAILPEMFATGYSMDGHRIAQPAGGPTESFLAERAATLGLHVIAGVAEADEPLPANRALLVSPDGSVRRYTKIHPFSFAGEEKVMASGGEVVTWAVDDLRVTPFVCYDLRFPEPFRLAADETDLYAVLANWPERRTHHWSLLLRARAVENLAYVAGVNRVGEGDGLRYLGQSALVGPWGETIASAEGEETVLVGDVSAGALRSARADAPGAFVLFWWNPVSLLTTCYHGNFDSLHTAFVLWAALLLARAGRERRAGLAWGAAIVLKKVPLLWAPALLASARSRAARAGLVLWGAVPAAIAFLAVVLVAPGKRNVVRAFTYTAAGYEGTWGLAALATALAPSSPGTKALLAAAPFAVVAASLLLVPRFRRLPPWRAVLLQILVFYLLSAGFGLQYLCWALPFVALAGPRLAIPFSGAATLHLSLAYLQGASKSFVHGLQFSGNPWNDLHATLLTRIAPAATSPAWDRLLLGTALVLWLVVFWTALEAARPDERTAGEAASV